jgi:NADH dehydrogenase FAD-containing subunit
MTAGFGLRRVPMEAYNRDNVRLVDLLETPIESILEDGLKTNEEKFDLDMIVYATGFSASK